MTIDYLFVYGTLRKNGGSELSQFLLKHANYVGEATFQGKLFNVHHYPGVIESENSQDRVLGELYQLTKPEVLLPLLDDYEECTADYPKPHEYSREAKELMSHELGLIKSWIYLYKHDTSKLEHIQSGDYLGFLNIEKV